MSAEFHMTLSSSTAGAFKKDKLRSIYFKHWDKEIFIGWQDKKSRKGLATKLRKMAAELDRS